MPIHDRKDDHLRITAEKDVEPNRNSFDDINLIHKALPEISMHEIDITCEFLGRKFAAPLLITGMTGGTEEAKRINLNLAIAAQKTNIPMGVGSQRTAIEHPDSIHTFHVRDVAPDIFLIGNLGIVQFITHNYGTKEAQRAIDMINADALALHINPSQEISQPEGDLDWRGCYDKIKEICRHSKRPIIAKEVGTGISREVSIELEKCGVSAIDVSGMGGTSWSLIESYRHEKDLGHKLRNWGIPTAVALVESRDAVKIPLIASGGMRNGIDIAKSLALGADMSGIALPLRKAAEISSDAVIEKIEELMYEIKAAMLLTGSKSIRDLCKQPVIITGQTREWLELRGIDVKKYARR